MKTCPFCIAELNDPRTHLWVEFPDEVKGNPEHHQELKEKSRGRLSEKVDVLEEALRRSWPVWMNDRRVRDSHPHRTWHGDEVCLHHLCQQVERESQPTTGA